MSLCSTCARFRSKSTESPLEGDSHKRSLVFCAYYTVSITFSECNIHLHTNKRTNSEQKHNIVSISVCHYLQMFKNSLISFIKCLAITDVTEDSLSPQNTTLLIQSMMSYYTLIHWIFEEK